MKNTRLKGFDISALTLGTVQLGLDYSLHHNQPSREQSLEILTNAVDQGISVLDTAREYGNSEELIGSFLKTRPDTVVVSKFKIDPELFADPQKAFAASYRSVKESLSVLGLQKLPFLLFHKGPQHPIAATAKVIPGILSRLKELDLIAVGGISVFEPTEMEVFKDYSEIEAFQVPINIFDHRLLQSGALQAAHALGKIVFARSIFLKGLFFKEPASLEGVLKEAIPYLQDLRRIAQTHQLSIAQLAFSYVQDIPEISSIVFGADTPDQVHQNIQLLEGPALSSDLRNEISEAFANVPTAVITPHVWAI